MSYTNETAHFGIPLPLGSDLTTPMDYNEAAEAVDTALFEAQGDAATANENAASAVETASAVSEALDTLSGTVTGHTSQLSALGARMTNAENNIDDVRSDLEDMITAFNEPTATSTHAYAIGDYFIYNDVLYKATAAITVGETIVPNTNCAATNVMTEVAAGGGSTPTAADVSLAPIVGLSADDVQEGIEELKSLIPSGSAGYRTVATATANQTYADQLASLDSAFAALSDDEKAAAILVIGDSIYHANYGSTHDFTELAGGGAGGFAVQLCRLTSGGKFVVTSISSTGSGSVQDYSSSTNTDTIVLKTLSI